MRLFNIEIKNSIDLKLEEKFFEAIKSANIWFTNSKFTGTMVVLLLLTDGMGFFQLIDSVSYAKTYAKIVIILAFLIAFEIAPLYIGYSVCLKCYSLGEKIHKWVFWLSAIAFLLGIVSNVAFRLITKSQAYKDPDTANAMTIVLIILPLITSLISIVIGCLSFNPLLDDMKRFAKKLCSLRRKKRQVAAAIEEYNKDDEIQEKMLSDDLIKYEKAKLQIVTIGQRLTDYVYMKSASFYDKDKNRK